MKKKYQCIKCGSTFSVDVDYDLDQPLCDKCFYFLTHKVHGYADHQMFFDGVVKAKGTALTEDKLNKEILADSFRKEVNKQLAR